MAACRPLAVDPELSGLSALARLLRITRERPAAGRELARYAELVERIGVAAADVALLGLFDVCEQFAEALRKLAGDETPALETVDGLNEWVQLARAYAISPGDQVASKALIAHLRQPHWHIAVSASDSEHLLEALRLVPEREKPSPSLNESLGALDSLVDNLDLDETLAPAETAPAETLTDDDVLSQLELTSSILVELKVDGEDELSAAYAMLDEDEHTPAEPGAAEVNQPTTALLASDEATSDVDELTAAYAMLDEAENVPGRPEPESAIATRDEAGAGHGEVIATAAETSQPDSALSAFDEAVPAFAELTAAYAMLDKATHALSQLESESLTATLVGVGAEAPLDAADSLLDEWAETIDDSADDAQAETEVSLDALIAAEPFAPQAGALAEPMPELHSAPPAVAASAAHSAQSANAGPPPAISRAVQEVLTVLIDELPQVSVAFDTLAGLAGAAQLESGVFANAVEHAADMLARLGSTAESLGLVALGRACAHLKSNLGTADDQTKSSVAAAQSLWGGVVPAIRDYLKAPYDNARAVALSSLLTDSRLASPMDRATATALTHLLANPEFAAVEMEGSSRPQTASPEDVSLSLPEDANPDLVDALLHELPQQTEELSAAMQRLLTSPSFDDVTAAQRIAHTIKGAGNTVGVRGIAELTHQLEDILLFLAKHEVLPTRSLAQTLISASDCLQGMAEALQGTGPAPSDSLAVLQEVLDWANRIEREGPPADESPLDDSTGVTEQAAQANYGAQAGTGAQASAGTHPGSSAQTRSQAGQGAGSPLGASAHATHEAPHAEPRESATPMLRVPSTLIDDLLRLVGEAMIQNSQLHERVQSTRQEARVMIRQFDLLQQIGTELEELIDLRDLSSAQAKRATDSRFDALEFDQYNELHTHSRRLIEAAVDAREIGRSVIENLGDLNDMLSTQERLNRDTQDGVLRTRMVPVKSVFPRLERSVRQTCRMTGKQVELHLSGGETYMDSDVLGRIIDPLMHVLRNAVDHGIESAEARESTAKDPTGHITLEFLRDGKSILVRCRDDGSGLDFNAIRTVAEQRGLVIPGGDIAEEVLTRFILLPNFTTRRAVTQTSGRGIGLDAVHNSVAELGGSLTLGSTKGQGCVVEIRLPVSLLSSNALLVRSGGQSIAITSRGIEQIRHVHDGEIRRFGGELVFHTGEQMIPASLLDSVLNLPASTPASLEDHRAVLIVRSERGEHAILVKGVQASRDVVVKTLGHYIPKLRGIVGATILGDGSVTPVIDLAELLRTPAANALEGTATISPASSQHSRPRRALVVDDSLSARKSMAQVLTDAGMEVTTARDGMEAVDLLEKCRPDILFVDLEMPRMNGIELTSHVRSRTDMQNAPILMITSRSTEKHRAQARAAGVNAYLTKPFDADTLLEQAERLLSGA